jgi:hypothetical protein
MIKIHVFMTTALMLFVAASTSLAQTADKYQWKLEDTDDGCQAYTSKVAGKEYIAAKATCVVPARMEVIAAVLKDIPNYPAWMNDCKETKVLKVVDEENEVYILWFRQHIPLLTDRDMVLKSNAMIDTNKISGHVTVELTKELNYDAGEGYVRMPSFSCDFLLEWVDREHTKVTFTIDPDLGKGIPRGIANSTIKKTPYKSLQGMKKIVKLEKYIDNSKTSRYAKMIEDGIKEGTIK